jgi:hypothetical protein
METVAKCFAILTTRSLHHDREFLFSVYASMKVITVTRAGLLVSLKGQLETFNGFLDLMLILGERSDSPGIALVFN